MGSSKNSVTFAEKIPDINFLQRIVSEESSFGNKMPFDHALKDMTLKNNMTMMLTPMPAGNPSTSSSSTDSKSFGTANSAFKSLKRILPSSLRKDYNIAQPTPEIRPTFEEKLNKITEIVNQNIRAQNIESKINHIDKNGFTKKSEFTEIKYLNNETAERNIAMKVESKNHEVKQIPRPSKMEIGDNSEETSSSSSEYLL